METFGERKEAATALFKSGRYAEAREAYQAAADAEGATPAERAVALANKAAAAARLGDDAAAALDAARACALDGTYARAKERLARLLVKTGDVRAAANAAEGAAPGSAAAASLAAVADAKDAGNAAFKAGDYAAAKEAYGRALEDVTAPGTALLLCNRAACRVKLNEGTGEAISDCDAALAQSEEYIKARMRRAPLLLEAGRAKDAEADYEELRWAMPGDPSVAGGLTEARRLAGSGAAKVSVGAVHVTGMAQYREVLAKAKGLVLVDFTASWCGPCRSIAPMVEQMATQYPTLHVLKVDVDECQDIAAQEAVRSMPTFKLYKFARRVAEFSGADPNRLTALVRQHL